MGTGDPGLTPAQREVLRFDYPSGERPGRDRLRAIEEVLRQIESAPRSSLHGEVAYAVDVIDRLSEPATDGDLEDLFWSVQNILDMPYGPDDS